MIGCRVEARFSEEQLCRAASRKKEAVAVRQMKQPAAGHKLEGVLQALISSTGRVARALP